MEADIDTDSANPPRHVAATGQVACWDDRGDLIACAGTGEDGELRSGIPWPRPRFATVEEGVLDRLTGLTWLGDAGHFEWPAPWSEALDAVSELRRAKHMGRDDWRLPDRRELWSLISFADHNPALPAGHPFRNVFLGWYWSSTTAARNPSYAWAVQMTGGRVFFEEKSRDAMIWPCRGSSRVIPATGERPTAGGEEAWSPQRHPWPAPRFDTHADRVVDRLTGLGWLRTADLCRGGVGWVEALDRVRRLDQERRTPWRLPTIRELESLLDTSRCDPSLPADHVFRRVGAGYWSSTTSAFEHDWAMVLHLARGAIGVGLKRDPRYLVWPVCDG